MKLRANRKLYSARSRDYKARPEHFRAQLGPQTALEENKAWSSLQVTVEGWWRSTGGAVTWSSRIWQTSGVKWRRAAKVLLRILRRPYWTTCKARCSEASVSAVGCLEEEEGAAGAAVGGR